MRAALLHRNVFCSESTLPLMSQLLLYVNHFQVAKLFTVQKIHFHCLELAIENDLQK